MIFPSVLLEIISTNMLFFSHIRYYSRNPYVFPLLKRAGLEEHLATCTGCEWSFGFFSTQILPNSDVCLRRSPLELHSRYQSYSNFLWMNLCLFLSFSTSSSFIAYLLAQMCWSCSLITISYYSPLLVGCSTIPSAGVHVCLPAGVWWQAEYLGSAGVDSPSCWQVEV